MHPLIQLWLVIGTCVAMYVGRSLEGCVPRGIGSTLLYWLFLTAVVAVGPLALIGLAVLVGSIVCRMRLPKAPYSA